MKRRNVLQWLVFAAVAALVGIMAACSSSGSGTAEPGATVTGVAATGAPMIGQVVLKDAAGASRTADIAGNQNGLYNIDVTGMQAPFILQASAANGTKHYSFAEGPGTANINPLTSAIVANAAAVTDPAALFTNADSAMLTKIKNGLGASTTAMKTRLAVLLVRYNASDIDPIKGNFEANHKGLDLLFDDADLQLTNDGKIKIKNRKNNTECFTGNIVDADGKNDTVTEGNLPQPAGVPTAPALTATAGTTQNSITWPAVTGATSYDLYFSTTTGVTPANGTKVAGVTSPYTHAGLTAGTPYYYTMTANNAAGASTAATQVTATPTAPTTPAPTAPAAPTLTATAGTTQNSITWPAVTGATSYDLFWSTTTGVTPANGTKVAGVTSPYTHTGLTAGTPYYYTMTANNAAGASTAATQATATPTAPTTPAPTAPAAPTLTATAGAAQNSITWPAVTGATSYDLFWSTTTGVTPANGTKVAGVTSPYTHTGLTASTPYYYTMTANNAAGASTAATQVTATPTAAGPDGAALYTNICAGCHGPLASSAKRGRSAATITTAKTTIPAHQNAPAFLVLNAAQISAIAVALGGAP